MNTTVKEQTAFRFEPEMIMMMKSRAKSLGKSLNAYVTDLIAEDLDGIHALPKVRIPDILDDVVAKYEGCCRVPTQQDLDKDERLARIWNR